jgi:Flp pilus assembly protein TadD
MSKNDGLLPATSQGKELWQQGLRLMDRGKWNEARSLWEEIVRLEPSHAPSLNKFGVCLAQLGEVGPAGEAFQKALAIEPKMAQALSNMGNIELSKGNAQEAVRLYSLAIRQDPGYSVAHTNLSAAYKRLGQLDKAVAELKKARSLEAKESRMLGYPAPQTEAPRAGAGGCFLWLAIIAVMVFVLIMLR